MSRHGKTAAFAVAFLAGVFSMHSPSPFVLEFSPPGAIAADSASLTDRLAFGNSRSEQDHQLKVDQSDVITGGLGVPARRLLPLTPISWEGGRASFTMKVDPAKPNYFTVRLWGDDVTQNRLILFCDDKQIGYRHLGDIDILDFGTEAPGYNGRFYYVTSPLPLGMTRGKTELPFEIRGNGRIWGYGSTFEQYQKPLTDPTRGIYSVYTHTDGIFVPPPDEKQGLAPDDIPVRVEPGPEVLKLLQERVGGEVSKLLAASKPLSQVQLEFLARAYFVQWTSSFRNPKVIGAAVRSLDATFAAYRKNPKLAESEPSTPNPDWFGLGPSGHAISLLAAELQGRLDESISDGAGAMLTRRAAWAEMLVASRDWHRRHRRQYTNQSMINDLYGIYLCNRGLEAVAPAQALPEDQARHYLYESLGLVPWLGSDTDNGPEMPLGDHYFQLTDKGLTKELGYVGTYGEVIDWATEIYEATSPAPGQPGDPKIKMQLVRIAKARAVFRRPALDAEGNRAMRMETIVGWRDEHYPGDVTYCERPTWDASSLYVAAAALDTDLLGYVQQMFVDNEFFASLSDQMKETGFRSTAGLLETLDQYELLKAQYPSASTLPMEHGEPDFAWADEEDGVLGLKHGDDTLYVSLYWRARYGINNLARVHYTVPGLDRIAVVWEDSQFDPSGLIYKRPDWVNFGFGDWGPHYPVVMHSAETGEEMPIAKIPEGVKFKPGDESPYAGKADFYNLRYGPFLIGMNTTKDKTFELKVPAGIDAAPELVSGQTVSLAKPLQVPPRSTVVLYLVK